MGPPLGAFRQLTATSLVEVHSLSILVQSRHPPKRLEPFSQIVPIRSISLMMWESDCLAVQPLDPRLQRRSIMLPEHGLGDDDPPVRVDTQQISVVSGVVQNRETVRPLVISGCPRSSRSGMMCAA